MHRHHQKLVISLLCRQWNPISLNLIPSLPGDGLQAADPQVSSRKNFPFEIRSQVSPIKCLFGSNCRNNQYFSDSGDSRGLSLTEGNQGLKSGVAGKPAFGK